MLSYDQKIAVLIDTQNMYHSAKHIHGARLAFEKVIDAVAGGRPVVRVLAYVAKSKTGEEQAFFDALQEAGIELRVKDVQEFASGEKKADWDVGMAIDAVRLAEKVDAMILMTGDGDFVPLVRYLQEKGVYVEIVAFAESTNAQLRATADKFFDISSDAPSFLMGSKRGVVITQKRQPKDVQTEFAREDLEKNGKGRRRGGGAGSRRIKVTF